ncbi:MAG: hypothetical protein KAI66_28225 [Lentisphaeria bacterium]|nr:hypothetical protein [Lentisphaeria bacterium]
MAKLRGVRRDRRKYERLLAEREREGLTRVALSKRSDVPISTLQEATRCYSWSHYVDESERRRFVAVLTYREFNPT